METQISFSNQEKYPRQGFMQRNALSVKIILIGVLILILLIPLAMIRQVQRHIRIIIDTVVVLQQPRNGTVVKVRIRFGFVQFINQLGSAAA